MTAVRLPPRADVRIDPGSAVGALAAPASKSVTNRLLVAAALAEGDSVLREPLESDDSSVMRAGVTALGARVEAGTDAWRVIGTGGRVTAPASPIDAGLSGTTMRFLTAVATLAPGPVRLTGRPPLLARPIGALVDALTVLGADVACEDGRPPVRVSGGGLAGGEVSIDVSASSQFASAVLLVAPYARADVRVALRGTAADEYVALTADVVRDWGAPISEEGARAWRISPGVGYTGRDVTVEYDASAAAHLFGLAAATGGEVTVTNATVGSRQPDARFPEVLEAMGCAVSRRGDALTVAGPERLSAIDVDLSGMPDQVTTLAALAALADGRSVLRGVAVARTHETDRLAALAAELAKLDVAVREHSDALEIDGGARGPATMDTYDDHRLGMAFASIGAVIDGVVVAEPWCVAKTYPGFWADARQLGVGWREVAGT